MKDNQLKEALDETVRVIKGYSTEELKKRLERSKGSELAKTVDRLIEFQNYSVEGVCDEKIL